MRLRLERNAARPQSPGVTSSAVADRRTTSTTGATGSNTHHHVHRPTTRRDTGKREGHKLSAAATQQHAPPPSRALLTHLETVAQDVGRIRRNPAYTGSLEHTVDRVAYTIEDAITMLKPPASVLYRSYLADGLSEDQAVTRALADVDSYHRQLHHLLRDDIREAARCDALELRMAA